MRSLPTLIAALGLLLFYSERGIYGQTNWLATSPAVPPVGAPPYGSTLAQTAPQPTTPPTTIARDNAPPPVYWGQDVFLIPYQWSAHTDPSAAKEVVLYLSQDRGANWSEIKRARPDVRSFRYRAPGDGPYWFAVRTLDASGRMWPAGGYQPELCVVVDTQIPRLSQPAGTLDQSGLLHVEFEALDPNLDTTSLRLAVRHAGSSKWIELPATAQPTGQPGAARITATWQAPIGVREVTLQAAIEDFAGNPAGSAGQVRMSQEGLAATAGATAQTVAVQRFGIGGAPNLGPPSSDPFLRAPPLDIPTIDAWRQGPTQESTSAPPSQPASEPWPADTIASGPLGGASADSWAPDAWAPANPPARVASPPRRIESSPYHNASASFGAGAPLTPLEGSGDKPGPVDPRNLLLVNHRQFALDYDLQSVGKWGVAKVEVWGTRDGGQTWRAYAQDSDNRSPVNITAPEPGRYGFRIVVQGVGSLPAEGPAPGDEPEVWVEVDPQPPTAQITSVRQGEGYFGDHLIVTWRAEDENLAARPVALSYSGLPSGPWMPIASNLENTSQYTWRLQRHLPTALYVRLEVRDSAGNVTVDQTQQPVTLEFSRPAGRIRAARPLGP